MKDKDPKKKKSSSKKCGSDKPFAEKVVGYKPMKAAPNAARFSPSAALAASGLPQKVDLRPHMTPVEDQGKTRSCVANAVSRRVRILGQACDGQRL